MSLYALANALRERYIITEEPLDLDESIWAVQLAVQGIPSKHPDRCTMLSFWGSQLRDKYYTSKLQSDLDDGILLERQAVVLGDGDGPDQAELLLSLALSLWQRYDTTSSKSDLEECFSHLQSVLNTSNAITASRVNAGIAALCLYGIVGDWLQAYKTANATAPLIPKLTAQSLQNTDKQHIRHLIVGFHSRAAAVALNAGEGPLVALQFLEQGRGVIAASLEELRTDILDLRSKHPEMAEKFIRLKNTLDVPPSRNAFLSDENIGPSSQVQTDQRYNAGNEFDKLVIDIRRLPGFEDFLRAPSEEEIRNAARCGPIVVINVSTYRCDALLIEQHQIRSLCLPHLLKKDIDEKGYRRNLESPKVLAWLWDVIASPILDALGLTYPPLSNDDWPHVWWIPTGSLSHFPIHAAGRHSEFSTDTVIDRVMSSYSSSIKAIISSRQSTARENSLRIQDQALLVAMQDTPGHSRLLYATKEIEALQCLCRSMEIGILETGRCKQEILTHLPNCKIFHFAGHGYTDEVDPSQSSLLLDDWNTDSFTVSTLLDMNLHERPPFLAYLSACGTGEVKDEDLRMKAFT